MSILTVHLPDQTLGAVNVADGDLVFNGQVFAQPSTVKYIALYDIPVSALTLEYKNVVDTLHVSQQMLAYVEAYNPQTVPVTDPDVVAEPNPSTTCVCFITCNGTRFQYVQVTKEP
jgi:hypothetical protein